MLPLDTRRKSAQLCTQMATLTRKESEVVEDYASATTTWGLEALESFSKGSGLIR
jgi:hypothetical protein